MCVAVDYLVLWDNEMILDFKDLKREVLDLDKNAVFGEKILEHTAVKIKLVSKYVDNWLYVVENTNKQDIYFIDLMSNAGLYENERLGTYVEVLNCFLEHARKHSEKKYHLICNDYDANKFHTMSLVRTIFVEKMCSEKLQNIFIECFNLDAKEALNFLEQRFSFNSNRFVLLFVDPYNLINFELSNALIQFCNKVYCELVLNYFFSDYLRNYKNEQAKNKMDEIKEFVGKICNMDSQTQSPEDVMKHFFEVMIKETKLNYKYVFLMKNSLNVPLYYLAYFTPHKSGLIKIKEATFKTFGYKNEFCANEKELDFINIFGETLKEAEESLIKEKVKSYLTPFAGKVLPYETLELMILQETSLPESKIITVIIKSFISEGILQKQNIKSKLNFKEDEYLVL